MLRSLQPLPRHVRAFCPLPVQSRAYTPFSKQDGPKKPFNENLVPKTERATTRSVYGQEKLRLNRKRASPKTIDVIKDTLRQMGYSLGQQGMYLRLAGRDKWYDYFWLREGCRCPRCVDPSTKQRNFNMADISGDITPETVQWNGQQLEIRWKNDIDGYTDHTTKYSLEYLRNPNAQPINPKRGGISRCFWDKKKMDKLQHWISFEEYMNDDVKFAAAMRNLSMLGIIFVKDIPDSREMVEKIATRMGPLRNTFYGSTWDVRSVPDAKNVAYTDKQLEFHMDLLYMDEPPGFQLLHCLENSCEGGETLFTDTFNVVSFMQKYFPDMIEVLTQIKLKYEYEHEHALYSNSWPVVNFSQDDRSKGLMNVNYSPEFQGHTAVGDWLSVKDQYSLEVITRTLNRFASIVRTKQTVFDVKLQPGQCVIFNNRRIAHSRNHFDMNSGQRWLAGAYVDSDALRSQFLRCSRDHPETWLRGGEGVLSLMKSLKDAKSTKAEKPEPELESEWSAV